MADAGRRDITIRRGDSYTHVVTMTTDGSTPIDITGRTYAAQARVQPNDTATVITFTCTVTDGPAGKMSISLTAAASAALAAQRLVWDLEETAAGQVSTILAGLCVVVEDVTR